jgi:hypothetical protein
MAKGQQGKNQQGNKGQQGAGQKGTDVTVQKPTDVVVLDKPDYIKTDGPGRGSENVGTDDVVIPRLEVVQALSPQVKEGDPKFNDDARAGMLVNSVTGQLYGREVFVVPVIYTKQWLVWMARKDKAGNPLPGGFFGAYNSPEEAQVRVEAEGGAAKYIESIDTPQHLCLIVDGNTGKFDEIMVSMPRTKAKISRAWNSMVKMAGGDRFSRVYRVATSLEKNQRGDFYNFAIAPAGFPALPLYRAAESLYKQVSGKGRTIVMDTSGFNDDDAGGSPNPSSEM